MNLQTLPLPYAPGAVAGLSERLMVSHHQNNYGGAVKRLNSLRTELASTAFSTAPGFVLNGLKREELIEWLSSKDGRKPASNSGQDLIHL